MKCEALHVEFYRRPLSSSHHEGLKINFQFLYLHFIFRFIFSVIREDSMRNTWHRKVIYRHVRP